MRCAKRTVPGIIVATVLLAVGVSAEAVALAPSARLALAFGPGSPAPPVRDQPYDYALDVANDGDVPLDNMVVIDTVPVEMSLALVRTAATPASRTSRWARVCG